MLWLPQEDTSVVVLDSLPRGLAPDSGTQPEADALQPAPDGEERDGNQLYELGNGERLQLLSLNGGFDPPASVALVPLGPDGFDRLEAIHRLLASLHGRAILPDTRLTRQQRARMRRMLQAYDGRRSGATLREIARVIFNTGPVSRDDWQNSSQRFGVMSLIRDANALMAGGYRKLLRHRRRS